MYNLTYACNLTSGYRVFGGGYYSTPSSYSGDLLFVALGRDPSEVNEQPWIGLPNFYASGSSISGSLQFTGKTYASLGIDPALFNAVFTFANGQTITLASAVPEPASCALIGGFGALLAAAFLRRRATRNDFPPTSPRS